MRVVVVVDDANTARLTAMAGCRAASQLHP